MKSLLVVRRRPSITLSRQRGFAVSMLLACLLLIANPGAHAQAPAGITNVDDVTSTPIPGAGHDYIKILSETVNPAPAKPELQYPGAITFQSTRPTESGDLQQR